MWFYKLLCNSLLNSLLQTSFQHLPIGQEIGTGVPTGKSLIVTPSIWRGPPHCPYEKANPPLALKNKSLIVMGGRRYHDFLHILKDLYLRTIWQQKDKGNNKSAKYRLCETKNKTIHHRIAFCPKLSPSMYLPVRHNKVEKVIYDVIDHGRTPIWTVLLFTSFSKILLTTERRLTWW